MLTLATVTREIYWNIEIPYRMVVIGILGLIPFIMIAVGVRRRWQYWASMNGPIVIPPREEWAARARRVLRHTLAQKRVRRKKLGGWTHVAIFWSFIALFIGTLIIAVQEDIAKPLLDWYFFEGAFYIIYSITLDVAGLAGIAGCSFALWRRHAVKPKNLGGTEWNWTPHLLILLFLCVQGFILEGARISGTGFPAHEAYSSPVGWVVALAIPESLARGVHLVNWWPHLLITIVWLGMFASTAMSHIFTAAATIWLARDIPAGGTPRPIADMENAEQFGVLDVSEFMNHHLRDVDACVECGRCTDVCPANITGKPLDPKKIVNNIRDAWRAKQAGGEPADLKRLVGGIITADELFSCTTCGACEQECPVMIEQVDKIVQMRRGLVLMESSFPEEVQNAFNNLEQAGNPWGKPADERTKWAEQLEAEEEIKVPIFGEEGSEDAEYLFWVGCAGALDARSLPITKAVATLMHRAGIKYAILGATETCTGDSALRIGNEYLYQVLAMQNIEAFKTLGVRKIITQCPHCFQTINKDYRALDAGLDYEVVHHSQFLAELLADGRIEAVGGMAAKAVIHDSCYLARHNGIIDQPREVAQAAFGTPAASPARSGDKTFCCGAGGGRMWMEEHLGHKNVNVERAGELVKDGADTILTSCPFCKTMIGDGAKSVAGEGSVRVMDIAEALLESTKAGAAK